jgi:hypothetical protein
MPLAPIDVVARPTAGDYLSNSMALTRSSMFATALGTFGTVTGFLALAVAGDAFGLIPLIGGLAFVTGLFSVPFVWWAIRQRRDLVLAPVHVIADDDGITWETDAFTTRHDWKVFRKVREMRGGFLLDTGANVAMLLSKRGIDDGDIERLRALFIAKDVMPERSGTEWLRPLLGGALGVIAALSAIWLPVLLGSS